LLRGGVRRGAAAIVSSLVTCSATLGAGGGTGRVGPNILYDAPSSVGHPFPNMQPGTHFDARLAAGSWCRSEPKGVSLNCQVAARVNFLIAEWGEIRLDLGERRRGDYEGEEVRRHWHAAGIASYRAFLAEARMVIGLLTPDQRDRGKKVGQMAGFLTINDIKESDLPFMFRSPLSSLP